VSDTLEALKKLMIREVWLLPEGENRLAAKEVAPDTPDALKFEVRRVDVNSVGVMALRAALDEHELLRYARREVAAASQAAAAAEEDGPPPEPDDSGPEDATMRAIGNAVALHAVLSTAMIKPSYAEAQPIIHGTALENALYRAIVNWSPELADPKTPAGS